MATNLSVGGLLIANECLGDTMLLTDVRPYYAYANGKRTDVVLGHKYTVVLPSKQFASVDVKVEGHQRITVATGEYVPVQFSDLAVKLYYDGSNRVQITAKAADIAEMDNGI